MIKSKLLKVITLATGLMTAGASFGIANGDIFEIRPCDQNGNSVSYNVDITNPMTSGEDIYFKVRLIRRVRGADDSIWRVKPNIAGITSSDVDILSDEYKLGIGIYVSGQERYAVLDSWEEGVGEDDNTGLFTDLIFKYTTRPGDVAFPIVLATENGPATDGSVDYSGSDEPSYLIRNLTNWEITNGDYGNRCNFWFWSRSAMSESDRATWGGVESPDGGDPVQDYSLAKCNFYVQTIGFDETWEVEGASGIWRSVHAGSTITGGGLAPKLTAKAPPEKKIELYVWSTDESVVRVKSNETVELDMDATGTNKKTVNIGKVVFSGGQITPADFQIEGVAGGSGQTCKLVMSPWKNYNYSKTTSTRITDYIEVPVKCLDPLPPTVTVETDRTIAYANGNYMVYGAVMSVYLSEAYDKDMQVKITPTIDGVAAEDIGKYIRFSETETEVTALPDYEIPTVTIPANSTAKKQVYIFCLRGDSFTTGTSRIVFKPSVDDADAQAFLKNYKDAGMQVVAEKPVIATPAEGDTIAGICGSESPVTIIVEDTYADSSDVDTGYQILVKYRPTDMWKTLDGRYCVGEGNALYLIDELATGQDRKTNKFPMLNYPVSGEGIQSQIKIISPVSGKESEIRTISADIKAPRTSNVVEAEGKKVFSEGESANIQITLSEVNDTGDTIFAFLKASKNVKAEMVNADFVICEDTDFSFTTGLPINKNQDSAEGSLEFLDGTAKGLKVQFEVILCETETFDPDKVIPGFDSNYLNVTIQNEEPVIKRIEMNGNPSKASGHTFPSIPKGMSRKFVAFVDDPGDYDKTNDVEGDKFVCKWTVSRNGVTVGDPVELSGNPSKTPFEYTFKSAGNWSVTLQVKDKDMDDWAEPEYVVNFEVLNNPFVQISADDVYLENENNKKINVGLSYWDDQYDGKLRVKLTVEDRVKDKLNYGRFKLDESFKSKDPADGDNVYYVELESAAPVAIAITELDGTVESSVYGFNITGEVVDMIIDDRVDADATLPTSGEHASTYYQAGDKQVLVANVDPVCTITSENTNRWVVSGGVCKSRPISWSFGPKSDISADFTEKWSDGVTEGIRVTITGPENGQTFYVTEVGQSGKFEPDFGNLQGDIDVTFFVEDKDGGSATYVYQYTVTPSKFLITSAHGPGGGLATSPLSRKYASLDGIGAGHTYAEGMTFSSAKNFRLTWNCGTTTDVDIFAFGYKVAAPLDDGSLDNGQDIPITQEGFHQPNVNGPFYNYPLAAGDVLYNNVKDSFFYCWILHSTTQDSKTESSILGDTFSPEVGGVVTPGRVALPNETTPDGNYLKTEVEAIFAREYFREDNLGDINYDGIPDVFAHYTWGAGNMVELLSGGTILENNLIALNGFNLDGDRLPKVYEGGQNNFNYAPIGPEFNARLEIRGFHPGLNAIDVVKSDPSFCDFDDAGAPKKDKDGNLVNANELLAWRAFMKARSEAEGTTFDEASLPTAADLLVWSPEPRGREIKRMDPTVEDTDGDGFPDGWEYYLWYRAHVTAHVPNTNVRFERFDFNNILKGTPISADEVEARFNPCEPLTAEQYSNNPDFDKDGLSDLEELAIGTNPCHWDTDGDRMCDGWEVMMNLNPLTPSDKTANVDGDFMAYLQMGAVPGVKNDDGTVTFYPQLTAGVDYQMGTMLDDEGNEIPDPSTFVFIRDVKGTVALTVTGLTKTVSVMNPETGVEEDAEIPHYYGLEGENGIWGGQLVGAIVRDKADFAMGGTIQNLEFGFGFVLLHDQVRVALGFDPRTAWSNIDGYVAPRWDPNKNNALRGGDMTGAAVNTREYTAYDEYLVMKYRHDVLREAGFDANDVWKTLQTKTTNPSVINPEIIDTDNTDDNIDAAAGNAATNTATNVTGNVTNNAAQNNAAQTVDGVVAELLDKAFQDANSGKSTMKNHGADTDGDGVPDGWELYMLRNPNVAPQGDEDGFGEEDMRDYDDDNLEYTLEYAGTDSCEVYRSCPSIYAKHPGTAKGWYNKFFPTNPGGKEDIQLAMEGADTDSDGIDDAQEGASFPMDFYNAGALFHELELAFIYGTPVDDGMLTCVRGGGMNPCTIDTDLDGIPDGWEMQHAGVPVDAATKTVVPPPGLDPDAASKFSEISKHMNENPGTFVADGIFNRAVSTNNTGSVVYIAGGMDATWSGDAGADVIEKGVSWDDLLGVARDVDFDHDGLQNYQEYYIQAVRHFRYDDISTPLMGRLLTESATIGDVEVTQNGLTMTVPGMVSANHSQKFYGYVAFDPTDPLLFATAAIDAGFDQDVVDECVNYEKEEDSPLVREPWTVDGWRNLGYFAPPVRAWDRATVSGVISIPIYMFPVTKKMSYASAVSGYIATDPRMADTDGDGMDDFYEMFHGLNPILGANVDDSDSDDDPDETHWAYFGKKGDMVAAVYNQMQLEKMEDPSLTTFNAYYNEWIYSTFKGSEGRAGRDPCDGKPIKAPMAYDPVMYPWLQGVAMADSDGDGIRNDDERVLANVADSMPRHTDPTPLWFTERTAPMSFVGQYYKAPGLLGSMPWYPSTKSQYQSAAYVISSSLDYLYSFEEGEGYDTDGDFKYDGAEIVTAFTRETDPLKFDDPSRRQALWFDGKESYALSAQTQSRPIYAEDLLKQFTVECWVCPEKEGEAQTIIDRSTAYVGDALSSDAAAIRANFRIGLDAEGRVYGMFDNNKSIESGSETTKSCQYVWGRKLNVDEWAHVALTFDGAVLTLYIDGEKVSSATTSLVPANGVIMIAQDPGSTGSFEHPGYASVPSALFIAARPVKASDVTVKDMPAAAFMPYVVDENGNHYPESFENVREFFAGYVDEVRVWDGARTAEEIKANYRERFDFEKASENRDNVLRSWMNDGTRNNNDGRETLPAELLFHYNFATLPGAVNAGDVAKTPAAFESQVVNVVNGKHYRENEDIVTAGLYNAAELRSGTIEEDMNPGWWFNSNLKSKVYDDYRVIPWIKNTVMHLTPVDGSALDSFLYTEFFGSGYTPAEMHGLQKYTFNNSAQPYSSYHLHLDLYQRLFRAEKIVEQFGDAFEWIQLYNEFALRSSFIATTDLVPLGGAYAKTCKKMWDRAASDAWELTGLDDDADGLPNSWEEYCRANYSPNIDPETDELNWDTIVVRDGIEMTAGDAYKYDIGLGWQPDKSFDSDYRATIDADGDNMPDWWENTYGIFDSTDVDDDDGDGLSNWAEYLLSEVFELTNADGVRVKFSPTDATSASEFDLDYFFKIGELYAGEIFTDHDFMDDIQEDAWGKAYTSRYAWDAASDNDEDGWSNFAEARYNDFTKAIAAPYVSHVVGDSEIKDMPIPTLKLTLRYNGDQPLTGEDPNNQGGNGQGGGAQVSGSLAPIVVQTYTDSELIKPDATFTVQPGEESENTTYIGAWDEKTVSGTLTPGYVNGTSLKIEFAEVDRNDNYSFFVGDLTAVDPAFALEWPTGYYVGDYETYMALYSRYGSEYIVLQAGEFAWNEFAESNVITITQDEKGENGFICNLGERIGTINLKTGDYSLDLTTLKYQGASGTNAQQAVVSMAQMVLRFKYNSVVPALQNNKLELFLGETNNGFVKEGKNTIVAFYDLDGDGKYTPGEPMGTATNVDVGWRQGKVEMELTDVSPIVSRMNLETGVSDRSQLFGPEECGDVSNSVGRLMVNDYERVRVVRSYTITRKVENNGEIVETMMGLPIKRVVFDKMMNKAQRAYIFEGDFLAKGDLDLDWEFLASEAINNKDVVNAKLDLTDIVYEVFFGDGVIPGVGVSADPQQIAVFGTMLVRKFDSTSQRPVPEAISPGITGIEVLSTSPVFKWKMPGGHNGYTAFKIQVRSGSTVVWESNNGQPLPVPARDADDVYSFEADAYIGDQLKNFESYTWRVSMYNAKFKTDLWSNELSFKLSAPENGAGYSSIPVAVKYFGPSNVAGASTFVVEAFTTPDFTGIPAARAVVSDVASVTAQNVQHPTNAVLTGLATGRYFLRAYADLNKADAVKRQRDSFESWGYACGRGKPGAGAFNPTAFELTDKNGFEKPVDIYIEDVDTNGNSLPDAWEYVKYGNLNSGTKDLDGNLLKTFGINKALADNLQDKVVSGTRVDAYNNYIMTAFASPAMTALALGYNPDDVTVGANGSIQVESKVESVEIKSVSFDANGNVVVEIDGELNTAEGNTNGLGFITLEGETKKTVTCQVLWKASLSDADWTVKATETIVVGGNAQTINIDGLGAEKSGFFKVVVTE